LATSGPRVCEGAPKNEKTVQELSSDDPLFRVSGEVDLTTPFKSHRKQEELRNS